MIRYSTNWMGPINLNWYRERGLTRLITDTIKSPMIAIIRDLPIGATYEIEVIHTHYAGGRIDIRGLPEDEYYDGRHEYGLPIMRSEDWVSFSDWLQEFKTEELLTFEEIIEEYESMNGTKIRWAK